MILIFGLQKYVLSYNFKWLLKKILIKISGNKKAFLKLSFCSDVVNVTY